MADYKTKKDDLVATWWNSPLGQRVLEQEKSIIHSFIAHFHGYSQLQLGVNQPLLPSIISRSTNQIVMADSADVQGLCTALPFKCHSIDTVLLIHALEFSNDPHQVLREAERVLVMDGTIILCSFNPWSLWGIKRLFSLRRTPPWKSTFFNQARIKDWLALLNFEVIDTQRCLFRPPMRNTKGFDKLALLEQWGERFWPIFSGVNIIVATKRTIPLTPVTMAWRAKQLFPRPLTQRPVSRGHMNMIHKQ